ncbi:MAG: DUF1553 domain-containing protein [Verrucomicrobiae bacterium]|nr:DUF1553 domain-containing protein [Verrucomicrobiae bacterium]
MSCPGAQCVVRILVAAGCLRLAAVTPAPDVVRPPQPPLPEITTLRLEPASLTLGDGRDARTVLVVGERADGGVLDLTGMARFAPDSAAVTVSEDGFISGHVVGDASVTVSAAGRTVRLPVAVKGTNHPPVGFVRDIEPILNRAGCSQGTCHGSAGGKNGFKLSLRGYDPHYDYQALVNDLNGRRFNRSAVDESLMLLKPLADLPHEGGQVLRPGSRQHELLRQWISEGARFEPLDVRATGLTILPETVELDLPGREQRFLILAQYPDGSTRDVTREAILSSNNEEVALVRGHTLTALRRGEMAVLVRYEGLYAAREVVVMGDRTGFDFAPMPEHNFVDRLVNAKLERMKINPSDLCTDAEFIRRVFLDLTGQPPTSDRVRAFLADLSETRAKREALIQELLVSPDYAAYWGNKFADLLQCNSENLGKKGVWVFREWIGRQFATNRPYDAFVRDLILAKGSTFENPAGNYLRALRDPDKMTEDISQTFLGVRFNCNKCHDHPFERWTQNQYYEFGAFFSQVAFKRGTLGRDVLIRGNETYASEQVSEDVVYHNYNGGEARHPRTAQVVPPRVPYGTTPPVPSGDDRRMAFAAWLTSPDNPYFAKSTVNRFWSYCFGRGIIDPVDDIRAGNPPSNAALLDALTETFVAGGFDVRRLLRTLCESRTYQLSIVPNRWNEDDAVNFSHALPRRLGAEQLLDAVAVATGYRPPFKDLPAGLRAVDLPDGMVRGNDFLALFGRPKRQSACECERSSNVTLSHALNLINGPTLGECVTSPHNRLKALVESEPDDRKVIEELYLGCLNRPPTEAELAAIHLGEGPQRLEAAQDLTWALLNTPAFLFNR